LEIDQVDLVAGEETSDQEKCIRLFALTVTKNVKCHSNQQRENQYIAEIAIKSIRNSKLVFLKVAYIATFLFLLLFYWY
jgi:hypothetical protein